MEIYLDNSATTRVLPKVVEKMNQVMLEDYGNPSSMHTKGMQGENYVRDAKAVFAKLLKVNEKELYFTSGGTESDNMALIGCARANARKGMHLITTKIEHPAILNTMKYLEEEGFEVTYLPVGKDGCIQIADLEKALRPDTILVSIMHTNNEVGSVQPIEEAGALIKKQNPSCLLHVDAVQGFGKAKIYPKKMNIDLLSVSSHKIHGPKGMGLLYVSEKTRIVPIVFGGGQQNNMRSGTENVPGIAGMALAAATLYENYDAEIQTLYELKHFFINGLKEIEDVKINGLKDAEDPIAQTAPHIVSASFLGVRSEVLLHALEEKGIFVSAGSACSSHKPQPSATLKAIGVDAGALESTIRFSFSVFTTKEELEITLQTLKELLPVLRRFTRKK